MNQDFTDTSLLMHDIYRKSLDGYPEVTARRLKNCALLIYTGESLFSLCDIEPESNFERKEKNPIDHLVKKMVILLGDSKGNEELITNISKDFLTNLYETSLIKGFFLNQKELKSWEEINEEFNLLWNIADKEEIDRKLIKISGKFLSAEAALFWIKRFGDSEVAEVETFLQEIKSYFQSITFINDEISLRVFDPINLKRFLTEECDHYVKIRDCDEFFLRWNALANQFSKFAELEKEMQKKEKSETRCFLKNSIRRQARASKGQNILRMKYHYENGDMNSHLFFQNQSQVTIEALKGELQMSFQNPKGEKVESTIQKEVITLGRMNCDLKTEDSTISRKQLEIFHENGKFYVSCLSPTNPTFFKLKPKIKYCLSLNMVINLGYEYYLMVKDISTAFGKPADSKSSDQQPVVLQTFLNSDVTNRESEEFKNFFNSSKNEESEDNLVRKFELFIEKNRKAKENQKFVKFTLYKGGEALSSTQKDYVLNVSKGKTSFTIGSHRNSDIHLDNVDYIEDTQCVVNFDSANGCWFIQEAEESLNGTFLGCKNYQELIEAEKDLAAYKKFVKESGSTREKIYKPSRKQELQKGMLVYFSGHFLEVI